MVQIFHIFLIIDCFQKFIFNLSKTIYWINTCIHLDVLIRLLVFYYLYIIN